MSYPRRSNRSSNNAWKEDIKIAKQLHYPQSVIDRLTKEPDQDKRVLILRSARKGEYK